MGKRIGRALILLLNAAGLLCLAYYGILFLAHDTRMLNPEAMLPMENWDRGGFALTLGLVPLAGANALAYAFLSGEGKRRLRLCWFIPAATCLALVICYIKTSA